MVLLVDIGNSHIVVGCYDSDEILHVFRMVTDSIKTEDGLAEAMISDLLHALEKLNYEDFYAVGLIFSVDVNTADKELTVVTRTNGQAPGITIKLIGQNRISEKAQLAISVYRDDSYKSGGTMTVYETIDGIRATFKPE